MSAKDQPTITLYRGWKSPNQYVWCPFVTKLELRFRLAGLSYTAEEGKLSDSPKGKIPHIALAPTNPSAAPERLSDSALIIRQFIDNGYILDLNARLSPADRATDVALRALLEEKLYFYHTQERWIDNYYTMRDHILQSLPGPVRWAVGILIYRKTSATLHGQGTGRLEPWEIATLRAEIWASFEAVLAEARRRCKGVVEEPFWVLGGQAPTEVDCVLFSFVNSVLMCTAAPESRKVVRGCENSLEYVRRIHRKYFPDYDSPFDSFEQ